ncbi:helix-turn-helix domain-containing protein [Bacillus sp. NPDC094106]|uniref:helix-turn-helix domain-containing protein n=1 Tax=Bacillus sp. NPDC094106 TaxID=3363949 RepID=UPI0037F1E210
MSSLAEKIKTLRREQKMTQKDFGKLMNVTESFVSKMESGVKEPSKESLLNLSKAINVPMSYFFEELTLKKNDVYVLFNEIRGMILNVNEEPLFKGELLNKRAIEGLIDGIDYLIRQTDRTNQKE